MTESLESRSQQTEVGGNDHVTMFILHLPFAVFSFSVKLSSFTLVSKARIILHCSHLRTQFANLTFAVCRKRNSKLPHRKRFTIEKLGVSLGIVTLHVPL